MQYRDPRFLQYLFSIHDSGQLGPTREKCMWSTTQFFWKKYHIVKPNEILIKISPMKTNRCFENHLASEQQVARYIAAVRSDRLAFRNGIAGILWTGLTSSDRNQNSFYRLRSYDCYIVSRLFHAFLKYQDIYYL